MKLRNLIFALFLAIGAIGFVSCTGDDGATGPAGPAGPAGPPGDSGDAGDASGTYAFLTSWGDDGTVTCGDDILEGSGPLPGGDDAASGKLTDEMPVVPASAAIGIACGGADGMFSSIAVADVNTIADLNLGADSIVVAGAGAANVVGLVLAKTGKGSAAAEVMNVPMTEFNPATRITTTKTFLGGKIVADLNLGSDSTQPGERLNLYSQCGEGTAPSPVLGDWRAVEIVDVMQPYKDGLPADQDPDTDGVQSLTPVVTTKVCVRLDSHPGATKCYVKVINHPVATNNGVRIALYDGTELTTIIKEPQAATTAVPGSLFGQGTDRTSGDDIDDVTNLCGLFDPADPS